MPNFTATHAAATAAIISHGGSNGRSGSNHSDSYDNRPTMVCVTHKDGTRQCEGFHGYGGGRGGDATVAGEGVAIASDGGDAQVLNKGVENPFWIKVGEKIPDNYWGVGVLGLMFIILLVIRFKK